MALNYIYIYILIYAHHLYICDYLCITQLLSFTVVTVGASCDTVVLWDYNGGKFEKELEICDERETVVQITCLLPFPLVVTSDSSGNVLIFGTRGCKWSGKRISGLLNQTPMSAEYEKVHIERCMCI
jgi:hypothetical protein